MEHQINKEFLIFNIPKSDILSNDVNQEYSIKIDYPNFSLGFQHYLHQSRTKMSLFNTLKNKVYHVVNKYTAENIEPLLDVKNKKLSYLKIFELLNLIDNKPKNVLILAKDDDSMECIKTFYNNKVKISNKVDNLKYDISFIINIEKGINRILQEPSTIKNLIELMLIGINSLNKNGILILKLYESFSTTTCKLLLSISSLFEDSYIYKPFTSKKSSSEKYLILVNFSNNNKLTSKFITDMNDIIKNWPKNNFLVNIYPQYNLNDNDLKYLIFMNTTLGNIQFEYVNKMILFIESQNYRGETYLKYKSIQEEGTNMWKYIFIDNVNNINIGDILLNNDKLIENNK